MNQLTTQSQHGTLLTPAALHHFYVTMIILSGVSYKSPPKIVGNSAIQIEETYYHVSEEKTFTDAVKNFLVGREFIKQA